MKHMLCILLSLNLFSIISSDLHANKKSKKQPQTSLQEKPSNNESPRNRHPRYRISNNQQSLFNQEITNEIALSVSTIGLCICMFVFCNLRQNNRADCSAVSSQF